MNLILTVCFSLNFLIFALIAFLFCVQVIILSMVVIPEVFADVTADRIRKNFTASRKELPREEIVHADEISVVWHFGVSSFSEFV
jgi:hypothetical protein